MIELTFVSPSDLTERDCMWLAEGAFKTKWRAVTALDTAKAALRGDVGIYRVTGGAEGLLVTERDGDMLVVTTLVGRNFLQEFQSIRAKLLLLAASFGCTKLAGYVDRPGLARLYLRHTRAKVAMTMFVENVV